MAINTNISINRARIVDPNNGTDRTGNIHISDGAIVAIGEAPADFVANQTIDATGLVACPGLIDLYARLREPGFEKKADIQSETRAALRGGITTLICSPDTDPVIDEVATVELIHRRALDAGHANVLPLAAMTRQLDGKHLSELATLKEAGCAGASNADVPIDNTLVLRRVMDYARTFDITLMFAPVDSWLRASGCAHEGTVATQLGLPGIPVAAETVALSMLIELVHQTGAKVHFSRITSTRGTELIAEAKARGLPVTADTTINHLFFTEAGVRNFDSMYRSVAPFRSEADRQGLRQALIEGTLDAVCSDHAPHEHDAKIAPFPSAEPGLSSLDTYLPLLLRFGTEAGLSLAETLRFGTSKSAAVFQLDKGRIEPGYPAEIILIDLRDNKVVRAESLHSRGKNTPYLGSPLKGRVHHAVINGQWHDFSG